MDAQCAAFRISLIAALQISALLVGGMEAPTSILQCHPDVKMMDMTFSHQTQSCIVSNHSLFMLKAIATPP